jgi:hypothetical protein
MMMMIDEDFARLRAHRNTTATRRRSAESIHPVTSDAEARIMRSNVDISRRRSIASAL